MWEICNVNCKAVLRFGNGHREENHERLQFRQFRQVQFRPPSAPLDRRALLQLAATGITIVGTGQMRTAHAEIWEEGDEQCKVQQAEASSLPDLDEVQLHFPCLRPSRASDRCSTAS